MSTGATVATRADARLGVHQQREVTLLDLLDRLLAGGVVVQGDITLAAADIDLVSISLRLIVAAVDTVGSDLRGRLSVVEG